MRRIISLFLLAALVLTGCTGAGQQSTADRYAQSVVLYYTAREDDMTDSQLVQSETRTLSFYTLEEFLNLYFKGPEDKNLESPFPADTDVTGISDDGNSTVITLSGGFFTLTSVDLSVACCCLTKTVCGYLNTDSITIKDEFGRISMTLHPDDYLLSYSPDESSDNIYTLYFADENQRYLVSETRNVTLSENESPEEYLLHELLLGPTVSGNLAVIPRDTEILDVSVQKNVCTVNFSSDILEVSEDPYAAYLFVFSVVDTLTGLNGINYVSFRADGNEIRELGPLSLVSPVGRYQDAVKTVGESSGQVDVDLHILNSEENRGFDIPVFIHQSASEPLVEAVVKAAVTFEPPCGMVNPIPYGTEVLSVSVSGSVCYLDVSSRIIPINDDEQEENKIVWSLVSTLTELDNVDSVLLTIEGESDGFRYIDLSEPLNKSSISFQN